MGSYRRFVPVVSLWFAVFAAVSVAVKGVEYESERLSVRLPILVILPGDTMAAANIEAFSRAAAESGGTAEFISKDAALAMLKGQLGPGAALVDSAVLNDIPGNPLPDAFLLRTTDIRRYDDLTRMAASLVPSARVLYDEEEIHRLAIATSAVRWASMAFLAILSALIVVSIRDRLSAAGYPDVTVSDLRGFATIVSHTAQTAGLSALSAVAAIGGIVSALGFASAHHPDYWMSLYVAAVAGWIRTLPLGGWFWACLAAGWISLVAVSCATLASFRAHPSRLPNASCINSVVT